MFLHVEIWNLGVGETHQFIKSSAAATQVQIDDAIETIPIMNN